MRGFLAEHGYKNGAVTIDASDWYIDDRLRKRLSTDSSADTAGYRDYYLQHIADRSRYYDEVSRHALGRSVKHTLLVHHNVVNELYLGDILDQYKRQGWKLIDAEQAYTDPIFDEKPSVLPAGDSLVLALAVQTARPNYRVIRPKTANTRRRTWTAWGCDACRRQGGTCPHMLRISMHPRIIWYPLLTAFLLSACEQRSSSSPPAGDALTSPPDDAAFGIPAQPVQGTVLGSAFAADQIILWDNRITFRQGKEFFADRDVTISVFPEELPTETEYGASDPVVRRGTITLSEKKTPSGLPIRGEASSYKLVLVFGRREKLGAPVQIDLETTGKNVSRIIGRGFATFDDIRVVDDQVDLRWDSLDTLRHVAKEYARRGQSSQEIEFGREFGVILRDPGTGTEPKTAFVGYEMNVAGAPASLLKLQLQKDESGWRVANALPSDQIDDAHPLDTTSEGRPARRSAEAVAGRMLELKLQREQLMPTVRSTFVGCAVSAEGGHGSCDTRYQLSERLGRHCYLQNYRMAYRDKRWVVVGEIGPGERVDVNSGAIVQHEPSMFGCGDVGPDAD